VFDRWRVSKNILVGSKLDYTCVVMEVTLIDKQIIDKTSKLKKPKDLDSGTDGLTDEGESSKT
jgi:hypothetical protein